MRRTRLRPIPLLLAALSLSSLSIAQTPSPSQPPPSVTTAPTPKLTPAEARVRLDQLNKELKELNEKLKRAEERVVKGDPELARLKSLTQEAKRDYDQAEQNWLDVHTRYTKLYHQIKDRYDQELQEKIRALADEYKQKFDNEWAGYQAKRAEENRLMQRRHDDALSRAKLAAKEYTDALLLALPELNAVSDRVRQIRAEQRPLIMLLKPSSLPARPHPLRPSTSSPGYPANPRRTPPESSR